MPLHGWFSKKQYAQCGAALYLNEAGNEVEITEVSNEKTPDGKWGDYSYVGVVVKFLRSVDKPRSKYERIAFMNVINVIRNAPVGSNTKEVLAKYFKKRLTVQSKQRACKKRLKQVIPEMEAACMIDADYQRDAMPCDFGYNPKAYHSWEDYKGK